MSSSPTDEVTQVEDAKTLREFVQDFDFAEALKSEVLQKPMRVIGAAATAAGSYAIVHLVLTLGHNLQQAVLEGLTQVPELPFNFFVGLFGGEQLNIFKPNYVPPFRDFDPMAFGAALVAGGMVLAGQNPGEVLVGIGTIIEGLIPT